MHFVKSQTVTRFYDIMWILRHMKSYFLLGKVQMEVICALLQEKYHVEIEIKSHSHLYGKTVKKAEYTIHIEVPPNLLGFHWFICITAFR